MNKRTSPCTQCYRVANPSNCENKNCKLWQRWFLHRWEAMRAGIRAAMDRADRTPTACTGNGTYDASPRLAEQDPCETCLCPRELCEDIPCWVRKNWEQACGEVLV